MSNTVVTPPAALRLRGHEAKPAEIQIEKRPRQTRMTRSILTLVGFLVLAPVVALIPPHIPWVLVALFMGGYLAWKQWAGEYIVHSFSGNCPRCDAELKIDPGSKVGLPLEMDCYSCHHKPTLVVEGTAAQ